MTSGGHARSGPPKDEHSLKSAKIGYSLTALPAGGFDGERPAFPLPAIPVYDIWFADKVRHKELDAEATEYRFAREVELWEWAWRTPQAVAWAIEPWRWHTVAMWVRTFAICESGDATAADKGALHRFADQIGLTPAGLKENGWKIAADQVAAKRLESQPAPAVARNSARDRLKGIAGGKSA